ncbi:hypothetical protein PAPHI01_2759 [Pancytospora philotis]|nr:hypothetical protein PAPHI01_2759 [Pancytospora philotis]
MTGTSTTDPSRRLPESGLAYMNAAFCTLMQRVTRKYSSALMICYREVLAVVLQMEEPKLAVLVTRMRVQDDSPLQLFALLFALDLSFAFTGTGSIYNILYAR